MNDIIPSTSKLLDVLKINNTKDYLQDLFLSNPNYPSLLSVSDVLTKYQVNHLAIKAESNKIDELPLPSMVQIKEESSTYFFILISRQGNKLSCYDNRNRIRHFTKDEFTSAWTGVALLAEKTEHSQEEGIQKRMKNKKFLNFAKILFAILLILYVVYLTPLERINIPVLSYLFFKVIGLILASLLLWYEYDRYNPTLQTFCAGGKKINCNSVLNSKYAKLFNGELTLSIIGFSYFFGSILYLLTSGFSTSSLSILSIMSFFTFPIIIASFYYQAFEIKQWCKFCIGVQIALLGEIAIGYIFGFYSLTFRVESLLGLLTFMLLPLIVWKSLNPFLQKAKDLNPYKRGLNKIKHTPAVFEALLSESRKIITSTKGMGITFKNDNAKYNVVKVCNPYCGPCSMAHPILEELVRQGKISLQILFSATILDSDKSGDPVRHFLAIDEKSKDKEETEKALADWYKSDIKSYDDFSKKYPIKEELLKSQTHKLEVMSKWCKTENIQHTPTVFVNGYELPNEYNVQELIDLL